MTLPAPGMTKYRVETHLIDESDDREWTVAAELDTDGTFSQETDDRFRSIYYAVMRRIREHTHVDNG